MSESWYKHSFSAVSGPTFLVRDWSLVDYCFDVAFGMLLHMAVGGYLLVNDVVGTSSCHRPKFWDQWFGGTQLPSLSNSIAATAVRESYCQQTEHPIKYIHSGNFALTNFLTIPLDWVSSAGGRIPNSIQQKNLAAAAWFSPFKPLQRKIKTIMTIVHCRGNGDWTCYAPI